MTNKFMLHFVTTLECHVLLEWPLTCDVGDNDDYF